MPTPVREDAGGERIQVFYGAVICGLALSVFAPAGPIPSALHVIVALLAGHALATGIIDARREEWRAIRQRAFYVTLIWMATLTPVVYVRNPDALRSRAIAALLVLLVGLIPSRSKLVLSAALLAGGVAYSDIPAHGGLLGDLEYAVGATWPRTWGDVANEAGLFLLGAWGATTAPVQLLLDRRAVASRWLQLLGALGRMPVTILLAHSIAGAVLALAGAKSSSLPLTCALLLAEMIGARWWLRRHAHGPVELALHATRTAWFALVRACRRPSDRAALSRSHRPMPAHAPPSR